MYETKPKAVVLLSGGLDSATAMAIALDQGYEVYALSFDYGQRHSIELEYARKQAKAAKVHHVVKINTAVFKGTALTDDIDVPKYKGVDELTDEVPVTYVPARNMVFLSFAVAWAETLDAHDIFIGVNALDFSGYPDCRPEFIEAFEHAANLATVAGISGKRLKVHAPLMQLTKAEIIKRGMKLGVDYSLTNSCYDPAPDGYACGHCDACLLRLKGFEEAGFKDPQKYVKD